MVSLEAGKVVIRTYLTTLMWVISGDWRRRQQAFAPRHGLVWLVRTVPRQLEALQSIYGVGKVGQYGCLMLSVKIWKHAHRSRNSPKRVFPARLYSQTTLLSKLVVKNIARRAQSNNASCHSMTEYRDLSHTACRHNTAIQAPIHNNRGINHVDRQQTTCNEGSWRLLGTGRLDDWVWAVRYRLILLDLNMVASLGPAFPVTPCSSITAFQECWQIRWQLVDISANPHSWSFASCMTWRRFDSCSDSAFSKLM